MALIYIWLLIRCVLVDFVVRSCNLFLMIISYDHTGLPHRFIFNQFFILITDRIVKEDTVGWKAIVYLQ